MNSGRGQMLALMSAGGDSENAISVSRTIVRDLRNFLLMDVKYSNRFQIYREAAKFDNTVALALSYVPMTVKNSYVGVSIDPKATKDGFRPTEGFLDNVNQILSEIQFTSKLEEIITSLLQDGIYVGRLHLGSKATVDDSGEVPSFKFEGRIDHMESLPIENVTLVDDETYSNKADLLRSDWVIRKVDHILVNEGYDSKGKKVGAAPAGSKLNAEVHLFPKEVLIISYQNEHHAQIDQNNRTTFGIWGKSPIDSVMVFIKGKITSFIDFLRWQHNAAPRWHHQLLLKELLNPDNFGGDVEKAKEEATRIFQEHKRSLYYTDDDPNSITYKQSLKSEPDEAFVTTDDINIDFKGGTGSNIQVIDIFQLCDRQISNRFGVSLVLSGYEEGSTYAVGKVSASFMSKMGNGLIRSIEDDVKKFLQNEFLYRGLQSNPDDWENMFLELETDDSEIVEATSLRKEKDAAILGSMASALSGLISGGIITADQAFDILQNGPEAIQKMKYTKPEAVKAAPAPQGQPITEGGGSNVPPAQNMGLKMPVISQNNGLLEKAHALEALHTALTTLEMAKDLGSMSGVEKELALGMQASLVSLAKDLQDQGEIPFDDVAEAYEQASIKFGVVPKKHNTTPIYMGEGRSVFRVEDDTGDWYFLRHAGKVVSLGYKMPDVSAWNVEKQFEKAFQKPDGMGNVAWDKAMIDLAKQIKCAEHFNPYHDDTGRFCGADEVILFRGVGEHGWNEMKGSEGGVHGKGIYFYTDSDESPQFGSALSAKSYSGINGGVIVAKAKIKNLIIGEPEVGYPRAKVAVARNKSDIEELFRIPNEITLLSGKDFLKHVRSKFGSIAEHYKCPMGTVKPGSCECPDDATPSKESAPDRNYRGLGLDAPSKLSGDMQSPDIKELNAILEESNTVKDADQDIKDAVGKYTNGEFHYVNNLLYGAEDELKRQGVEDQKIIETRELVAKLDKIFETSELKHDIVTYRGIGGYAYSKMTDEVRNALQTPGSEIEFPAFLSTSVRSDYAVSFSDVGSPDSIVFEMRLPQGTKATYVATESAFPREMEMLVNRGTRFKVVSEPRIEAISLGRDKFSGDTQPTRTKVITLEALT